MRCALRASTRSGGRRRRGRAATTAQRATSAMGHQAPWEASPVRGNARPGNVSLKDDNTHCTPNPAAAYISCNTAPLVYDGLSHMRRKCLDLPCSPSSFAPVLGPIRVRSHSLCSLAHPSTPLVRRAMALTRYTLLRSFHSLHSQFRAPARSSARTAASTTRTAQRQGRLLAQRAVQSHTRLVDQARRTSRARPVSPAIPATVRATSSPARRGNTPRPTRTCATNAATIRVILSIPPVRV